MESIDFKKISEKNLEIFDLTNNEKSLNLGINQYIIKQTFY